MLGNPIGVLIGLRAGLTFEDFLRSAFPIMLVSFAVVRLVLSLWFRKAIKELDGRMKEQYTEKILRSPRLSGWAVALAKGNTVLLIVLVLFSSTWLFMIVEKKNRGFFFSTIMKSHVERTLTKGAHQQQVEAAYRSLPPRILSRSDTREHRISNSKFQNSNLKFEICSLIFEIKLGE